MVLLLIWLDSAFFRARYSRCLLFISCLCSSDISARCFRCFMFLSSLLRSASSRSPVFWMLVISLRAGRFCVGVSMIKQDIWPFDTFFLGNQRVICLISETQTTVQSRFFWVCLTGKDISNYCSQDKATCIYSRESSPDSWSYKISLVL